MPNLTTKHARLRLEKAAIATRLGIFCKTTAHKRRSDLIKTTKSPSGLHKKPDPFFLQNTQQTSHRLFYKNKAHPTFGVI